MDGDATPDLPVADFDFELPRERIAARPARPRDASRLLEVRGDRFGEHVFGGLPDILNPGDLLIFNDTKVIPARLKGRRGEANVEVTLHKRLSAGTWLAFARPAKRLKLGDRIDFADDLSAEVAIKGEGGEVGLAFGLDDAGLMLALAEHGEMPLPPYIARESKCADAEDRLDY